MQDMLGDADGQGCGKNHRRLDMVIWGKIAAHAVSGYTVLQEELPRMRLIGRAVVQCFLQCATQASFGNRWALRFKRGEPGSKANKYVAMTRTLFGQSCGSWVQSSRLLRNGSTALISQAYPYGHFAINVTVLPLILEVTPVCKGGSCNAI